MESRSELASPTCPPGTVPRTPSVWRNPPPSHFCYSGFRQGPLGRTRTQDRSSPLTPLFQTTFVVHRGTPTQPTSFGARTRLKRRNRRGWVFCNPSLAQAAEQQHTAEDRVVRRFFRMDHCSTLLERSASRGYCTYVMQPKRNWSKIRRRKWPLAPLPTCLRKSTSGHPVIIFPSSEAGQPW